MPIPFVSGRSGFELRCPTLCRSSRRSAPSRQAAEFLRLGHKVPDLGIRIVRPRDKLRSPRGMGICRSVGPPLVRHLVESPGTLVTPEVESRFDTLLSGFFVRRAVAVCFHSMIPFRAVNLDEPARFFDCRRETPVRNANGYFGLFLMSTSLDKRPSRLTTATRFRNCPGLGHLEPQDHGGQSKGPSEGQKSA